MKFKNTILILSIALLAACTKNNSTGESGFTTITGTFNMPYITEVTLSRVEYGQKTLVSTAQINDNKEFGFALKTKKEGFYILSGKTNEVPLYIKKNQFFSIKYDTDGYQLIKSPDKENDILYNWVKSNDTLQKFDFRKGATTYKDFFPFYTKFIPVMKKQHDLVTSNNKRFNELMNAYIDLNIERVAINFLFTPRPEHPKKEQHAAFYKDFMNSDVAKKEIILDLPDGINALRLHQMYKTFYTGGGLKSKVYNVSMFSGLENAKLRANLALGFLRGFKSYNKDYLDFIEPLRKDIAQSKYASKKVDEFEVGIKVMSPGVQGYPFTYKDKNGKDVSFSDFKGKYVYIDVWATWCAPCKKEIPYLKKLEKELHKKNIVFVSISVDKQKDLKKWKAFIKDKELGGIQLFSDDAFNTRIAKDYKINAIPRFLLFDNEGKIVDANAKRPSNPQLKTQLLKLLK